MKSIKKSFVSLFGVLLLITGCAKSPHRNFLDQDLLFNASVLPAGWEFVDKNDISYGDTEGQISGAYEHYYNALSPYWNRVGETVYRYANASKARWHYGRMEKELFNDQNYYSSSPWQVPSAVTFTSQSADHWRFGCAGSTFLYENDVNCVYLAQYDEFIIQITFAHQVNGEENISLENIQQILNHVDELVTLKLSENVK